MKHLSTHKDTYSKLSDDVKIADSITKTRGQLQEHLRLNAASLSKYQEVREVVINYIQTKQIFNKDP